MRSITACSKAPVPEVSCVGIILARSFASLCFLSKTKALRSGLCLIRRKLHICGPARHSLAFQSQTDMLIEPGTERQYIQNHNPGKTMTTINIIRRIAICLCMAQQGGEACATLASHCLRVPPDMRRSAIREPPAPAGQIRRRPCPSPTAGRKKAQTMLRRTGPWPSRPGMLAAFPGCP